MRALLWFIWLYIKGAFIKVGAELTKDLVELALRYIREAALNPSMTNEDRRAWVAEQLRNHAIETGNPVADSVINLIIEIALQKFKTDKT